MPGFRVLNKQTKSLKKKKKKGRGGEKNLGGSVEKKQVINCCWKTLKRENPTGKKRRKESYSIRSVCMSDASVPPPPPPPQPYPIVGPQC